MSLSGNTVLVTGATGFLGSHLVKRLSTEGARVIAVARRPERDRYINDLTHVQIVRGDITDFHRMRELISGIDFVFHVAAALGGNLKYQNQINVGGTEKVARASAEAGVKRMIYVSSIASYGFPVPELVTEDQPIIPSRSPYNVTKAEGESILRIVSASKGLSYSIVRPAMIYGPRNNTWTKIMFQLARRNPTPFIGDGSGHAHPIFVDDVVDMMVMQATHPQADGATFNCAPDPAPTWREFLGAYSNLAGHQNWSALPAAPFKVVAPFAEVFARLRGEPRDFARMIDFITSKSTYSMSKAKDLLGWQASVSLEDGIQQCVPYLKDKGLL